MKDKKPKFETLNDFKISPKSWAEAMVTGGRKYTISIEDLRQLAIKWVKRDIEDSVDDFIYTEEGKEYLLNNIKQKIEPMPNGKFCMCDPESSCTFHREGQRLIEIFNIEKSEIK